MLESLHIKNVGPAPEMKMNAGPRLNLITGDNGLGKTFLLDTIWWALTRTWAGYPARPSLETVTARKTASIAFKRGRSFTSKFSPQCQGWTKPVKPPTASDLVIYARADGHFAISDPIRYNNPPFPSLYQFTPSVLWNGLSDTKLFNGALYDLVSWQLEKGEAFEIFCGALKTLSTPENPLIPGKTFARISVTDVRNYPTLQIRGEDIPVVFLSAAMQRLVGLAYLLVWMWREHKHVCQRLQQKTAERIIFLVDDVDSHLHPQGQRTILGSLLKLAQAVCPQINTQLFVTTHAPLVLASAEPFFDADRDALFTISVKNGQVVLDQNPFIRHGETDNWLVSEPFGLKEPRSLEGEKAIQTACSLAKQEQPAKEDIMAVDTALRNAGLSDIDRFWVRWGYFREKF